jgi:hypothetical protein
VLVLAEHGRQLARQPRPHDRALAHGGALHAREHRDREHVGHQRRRDRIAGHADGGRARDGAEHHRMARPQRGAVHRDDSERLDRRRRVVVAAGRRARADEHEIALRRRGGERLAEPARMVGDDGHARRRRTRLAHLRHEHERVRVGDRARPRVGTKGHELVPGRHHEHVRSAADRQLRQAGRAGGRDVGGAQPLAGGQEQLAGGDVLADRPHVAVRRRRRQDLHLVAEALQLLEHDHGVEAVGHRVARVDGDRLRAEREPKRRGLARAGGLGGAHRDPVHRGAVERRRRPQRPSRLGGDSAERVGQRHRLGVDRMADTGGVERAQPAIPGLAHRHVVEVVAAALAAERMARGHAYGTTSTSAPAARPPTGSGTTR